MINVAKQAPSAAVNQCDQSYPYCKLASVDTWIYPSDPARENQHSTVACKPSNGGSLRISGTYHDKNYLSIDAIAPTQTLRSSGTPAPAARAGGGLLCPSKDSPANLMGHKQANST